MTLEFHYWLTQQIKDRNLSQSDLARAAGVGRGTISSIANGKKQPGFDVCIKIAKGLRLPPELVLTKAGYLANKTKIDPILEEAMHLFKQIPEQDQRILIDLMHVIAEKKEKYSTK